MKKLIRHPEIIPFIILFLGFVTFAILISSCNPYNQIHEDTLYVTRKYIGNFDTLVQEKKATAIYTDQAMFRVIGHPPLEIPDSARCYLRYIKETLPRNYSSVWVLYFTWDGTEDLIKIRQNWYTGETYTP